MLSVLHLPQSGWDLGSQHSNGNKNIILPILLPHKYFVGFYTKRFELYVVQLQAQKYLILQYIMEQYSSITLAYFIAEFQYPFSHDWW